MGRDGTRKRKPVHNKQESHHEHAVHEQQREREAVLENFGIEGTNPVVRYVVWGIIILLVLSGIGALIALTALA